MAAEVRERLYDGTGITYLFKINERVIIDGARGGNEARFINHSCNPNCVYIVEDGDVNIYAKKHIQKEEELTMDYQISHESPTILCNCGAENCRGRINPRRPPEM